MSTPHRRPHILTVALEDYFQVGAFNRLIQQGQWYRFETRLEQNAERVLNLLERHNLKATFFVLGWIADQFPELVKRVADRGHEIASKGYYHRGLTNITPQELRDDLLRSREALEHAAKKKVVGYRVADGWFRPEERWALTTLAEAGYLYDSSIAPIGRAFAKEPQWHYAHDVRTTAGKIWELPISTRRVCGFDVPIAGGNYIRQLPPLLIRRAIDRWHRTVDAPLVFYFHAWELDPEQPKISASSRLTRIRHYRNLHKMEGYLEYFFKKYAFTTAAGYLGLPTTLDKHDTPRRFAPVRDEPINVSTTSEASREKTPITIVVPCYNEELILPYLANTLSSVKKTLGHAYSITYALVDDGSKDNTWEGLQKTFADKPSYELYRHEHNRGVAAAILTGIQRAKTEIVCSIDCDCTYDPHSLATMIPQLRDDVDLVTASPYHPDGLVRNVPGWRLKLSKSASWLYRRVLHNKLATYTSCFRVYRRSAVMKVDLQHANFLGIAELLGKMDLQGSKIVEFPATLEVRMLGRSKMKTLRTILGHLKLMRKLLWTRLTTKQPRPASTSAPSTTRETEAEHTVTT